MFEEHRATDAIEVGKAPADLPPNTYSDAPRYAVTSAANVLLLDALNTPLSDQVYVRRRMLQYLHTIPPGTRIAVFTLGSKLRIIEGFTTDSSTIEKALQGRGNPEKSPVMDPDWDQTLERSREHGGWRGAPRGCRHGCSLPRKRSRARTCCARDVAFDAMEQLARYLATVPGRKNVIWFSGSMPFNLTTGSSPNLDQMADLQDRAQKDDGTAGAGASGFVSRGCAWPDERSQQRGPGTNHESEYVHQYSGARCVDDGAISNTPGMGSPTVGRPGRPDRGPGGSAAGSGISRSGGVRSPQHGILREADRWQSLHQHERCGESSRGCHRRWLGLLHAGLRAGEPRLQRRVSQGGSEAGRGPLRSGLPPRLLCIQSGDRG